MHRAFNPWYAAMRSIVFRHPVIPICSCRIMDKPDGSGPSNTRSIRVRNINSLLQVVFKIAILFIVRNRGVSSHDSRLWCPLFSFLPSHIKIKKCYKNPFRNHFFSSFPIWFHTSFLLFFIFCTKTGILHPSQFGVIEGRNIFSSSLTLKTEYPASWDDTGAECACPHACIEKTLRKKRDRNGPRRAGRGNNQTKLAWKQ